METMETITINGVEYVEASRAAHSTDANWGHVCVIATNGWIFEGYRDADAGGMTLADASVVRCWSNGLGIGGLADPAHKDDYTLDRIGVITVHDTKIVAVIPLGW